MKRHEDTLTIRNRQRDGGHQGKSDRRAQHHAGMYSTFASYVASKNREVSMILSERDSIHKPI